MDELTAWISQAVADQAAAARVAALLARARGERPV